MKYAAFMSYSHAADARLATAVQTALHRFARPLLRARALWVWRDKTSLSATSALWGSIERALADSEYLLLVASPASAASHWVQQEVTWWLNNRPAERILILLAGGELHWDASKNCFDAAATTAIPVDLRDRYRGDVPLYVDLRWATSAEQMSLRHSQFRDAILDVAATLHGRSKEDLDGEDVRLHRRTIRVAWALVSISIVFAIAAGFAAYNWYSQSLVAEQQRQEAVRQREAAVQATGEAVKARDAEKQQRERAEHERANATRQAQIALGRQMLVQSQLLAAQNPELQDVSTMLAIEGMGRLHQSDVRTVDADHALRTALDRQPRLLHRARLRADVDQVVTSLSGRFFAAHTTSHGVGLYAVGERKPIAEMAMAEPMKAWAFSTDGQRFGVTDGRSVFVVDLEQRRASTTVADAHDATSARFSSDVQHLATVHAASSAGKAAVVVWTLRTGEEASRFEIPTTWKEAARHISDEPASLRDGLRELLGDLAIRSISVPEDFGVRRRLIGPAGRYVLIMGFVDEASQAYIYDPERPNRPVRTYGMGERLATPSLSLDGQYIAFAVQDTVRFGTVPPREGESPRREVQQSVRAEAPIGAASFSINARALLTVVNRTARAWDVTSGAEICRVTEERPIRAVDSNVGRRLVTAHDDTVDVWSCETGVLAVADGFNSRGALHPDGRVEVAGVPFGLSVHTLANGTRLAFLTGSDRGRQHPVWSPRGDRLAAGRHGVATSVWDWPSARPLQWASRRPTGRPLAFSPDGRYLALGQNNEFMEVVDLRDGTRVGKIDSRSEDAVMLGDGARYVVVREFNVIPTVWNVRTGMAIDRDARVRAVTLNGSGGRSAAWRPGAVQVRDVETSAIVSTLPLPRSPRVMALSADATYLATASDNAIAVWLLATLTPVFEVTVDYRVRDLAFSPTGRVLAAVHERLMQLWDLDRKMEIARMPIDIDWWGEDQPEQPWTRFLPAAGLISLNAEYRSRFWLWRPDDMIRSACTLLTVTPSTLARWKAVAGDAGDPATCGAHQ